MNIKNIAIVRATDNIPINGMIVPVSETHYIEKNRNEPFNKEITKLLIKKGIISPIDYSQFENEKYREEKDKEIEEITNKYTPYTSNYNSMVLFSLNGIVPDDKENGFGNNTFSNKKCGIIESLSSHIDNVISLNPIDTAIKGTVKLSNDATILIEKNTYDNLSIDDKNKLNKFNVITFEGNLKDAIESYLRNSKKYTCEKPIISSSKGGFLESPTSEELKKTIKTIADERKISTAYHLNILLHNTEEMEKLDSVKNEHENILKIKEYYKNEFYKFLFSEMPVDESLQYYLFVSNADVYIEELCEVINEFGLDNYRRICDKFNYTLELLKRNKILPTPEEIINSINKGIPIDLCNMIRNFNIEEYKTARHNYQTEEINKIKTIQNNKISKIQKGRAI